MGTTDRGYPYPEGSDDPYVHLDLAALAGAVDDDVQVQADRLDPLRGGSPSTIHYHSLSAPGGFTGDILYKRVGGGAPPASGQSEAGRVYVAVRLSKNSTGTASNATFTIGTLPSGFRPSATLGTPAVYGSSAPLGIALLDVGSDGVLTVRSATIPGNGVLRALFDFPASGQ